MQRRDFLRRALAGAAGAQIAAWTGACAARIEDLQADPPPSGEASAELLRDTWSRARAAGRPMLVLIVPTGEHQGLYGQAWGQLLMHGSEETLARLAGCSLVAAKMEWVHAVLSGVEGLPSDEPSAIFVHADGRRAEAIRADLSLERWPDWDEPAEAQEKPFKERVARLEAAIAGAVNLGDAPKGDAARFQDEPPAGTAWAVETGCAPDVIGHPEIGAAIACGMGFLPAVAARFLFYLTDLEDWGVEPEECR